MRILARAKIGLGNGRAFERGKDAAIHFRARQSRLMRSNRFGNLRAHAHDGIERGHRFLKNHGDVAAAHADAFPFTKREKINPRVRSSGGAGQPRFPAHSRALRQ